MAYGLPPDPFAPPPAWDGPWPPDASWDAAPPILPPAPESPVPDVAFAGGDEQALSGTAPAPQMPQDASAGRNAGGVELGFPSNPDAGRLDEINPDLVELDAGEPDWSGLEQADASQSEQPWDADLIEQDEPEAAPLSLEERAAGLEAIEREAPGTLAKQQLKRDMAAEGEANAARATAAARDREEAEASERIYRDAMARTRQKADAIQAESDRLATEKIDPDGWVNSRNLFQTLAMFTAGIVGGLVQSRTGGPNSGLAIIDKAIEQHIDAQKANLSHRKDMLGRQQAAVGQEQARAEQDFLTEESFRQAAWKRTLEDIETQRMQFNPAGTQALKLAGLGEDIRGRLAASQQATAEKMLQQDITISEENRKREKHMADMAKTRAETAKLTRAGTGGGQKLPPAYFVQMYGIDPKDAPKVPLTEKEFARYLSRKGNVAELRSKQAGEERTAEKTKAEGTVFDPLTGNPIGASANVAQAGKAQEALTASAGALKNIDTIIRLADKAGGSSDFLKSAEWQEITANKEIVKQQIRKAFEMGTLDASAAESIDKILGGVDPTSFLRDAGPGLRAARRAMQAQVNDRLKGAGIKEQWAVPDMSAPPKAKGDEDVKALNSKGARWWEGGPDREDEKKMTDDQRFAVRDAAATARAAAAFPDDEDMQHVARVKFDGLVSAVEKAPNPATRKAAFEQITKLAGEGNPWAMAALDDARAAMSGWGAE